ncbi:MAG TPA: hypothetical protein VHI13_05135 [Candidatus Kapabacteria bacterium]|nr:hypothetical protein [Candidatus Kapabacteria bacterium]
MQRLRWAMDRLPHEERAYWFCIRVAGGNLAEADRLYSSMPHSDVWRRWAHDILYTRYIDAGRQQQ